MSPRPGAWPPDRPWDEDRDGEDDPDFVEIEGDPDGLVYWMNAGGPMERITRREADRRRREIAANAAKPERPST